MRGSSRMLRKTIDIMNDRKVEIDIRNSAGYSALLLAIQSDNYLSAYFLLKYGNSSPSLQDNEKYFNALEWLLERIRINKNTILTNQICNDFYTSSLCSQLGYTDLRGSSFKSNQLLLFVISLLKSKKYEISLI